MSPKQRAIMAHLRRHDTISLDEAVTLVGGDVYANKRFHVRNVLSRMVRRGLLIRAGRGLFVAFTPRAQSLL